MKNFKVILSSLCFVGLESRTKAERTDSNHGGRYATQTKWKSKQTKCLRASTLRAITLALQQATHKMEQAHAKQLYALRYAAL